LSTAGSDRRPCGAEGGRVSRGSMRQSVVALTRVAGGLSHVVTLEGDRQGVRVRSERWSRDVDCTDLACDAEVRDRGVRATILREDRRGAAPSRRHLSRQRAPASERDRNEVTAGTTSPVSSRSSRLGRLATGRTRWARGAPRSGTPPSFVSRVPGAYTPVALAELGILRCVPPC
jgi:hypothetical protein